jgi:hypothetical protein
VSKPAKLNFAQSLIAVLAGNLVYFLLMPHLPPAAQHIHKYDLGMFVDFGICLVIFVAIKKFWKPAGETRQQERH